MYCDVLEYSRSAPLLSHGNIDRRHSLAPAPAPESRHSSNHHWMTLPHMYLNLFVAWLRLLFSGCSRPRRPFFEAFVQSGSADNIFPASTSRPIPISSCSTRTYYHRYGLLISSCVSSLSSPLRWPCPSLLLRLSETLGTPQDKTPTPIHRHR
jgi:hypothetical protein